MRLYLRHDRARLPENWFRRSKPETRNQLPDMTPDAQTKTRNPKPETRNRRNLNPETRNSKPETKARKLKPETDSNPTSEIALRIGTSLFGKMLISDAKLMDFDGSLSLRHTLCARKAFSALKGVAESPRSCAERSATGKKIRLASSLPNCPKRRLQKGVRLR